MDPRLVILSLRLFLHFYYIYDTKISWVQWLVVCARHIQAVFAFAYAFASVMSYDMDDN